MSDLGKATNGEKQGQGLNGHGMDRTPSSDNNTTLHEEDHGSFFEPDTTGVHNDGHTTSPSPSTEKAQKPERQSHGRFPRISLPVEMMRDSYDVVVIGTGYGGSVAASRMARGRQSVCVLERGKERWPGEYPEKLHDAAKEIRISGEFAPGDRRGVPGKLVNGGNPTGLYHFTVGNGQNVYTGNGLGGTSLVNANVFLEATPAVLEMDVWPKELRGTGPWRKYYDRAIEVLEPVEYPKTFPDLKKADLLKKQADLIGHGDKFYRVKQTTRFQDGPNSTGVPMRASSLTGMDATGINDGSKSTTLVNYLSDAWNWGAEMFCECEVRYVTKAPDREGYIVYFSWYGGRRDRFKSFGDDPMWVHAKKLVFFGAGSLGTTEILLRSRQFGLKMSDDIGTGMSGNGDMLGFGYNTDHDANCLAHPSPSSDRPVGPCITSVLDLRDQNNPLDGFVVEDCSVPHALSPFMIPMLEFLPDPRQPVYTATKKAAKIASRLGSTVFGPHFPQGSVARTAVYLIMSHDSSQGTMTLRGDKPVLTYSGVGRSDSVSRIHEFLEKMTAVVGGNFIANPAWTLLGAQEITVHPIGGAQISPDGTGKKGVTNHMGEIFTGNEAETYPGLVVCDGSMVPGAVGVNPFATITALAERSADLIAQKYGIEIDYGTKNGILDMFGSPAFPFPRDTSMSTLMEKITKSNSNGNPGVEFAEVMTGFIHVGDDVHDFDVATNLARSRGESARVFLNVKSWDTSELVYDKLHPANITGTLSSSSLGGIFIVHRGTFQLFTQDKRKPDTANLLYKFEMTSPGGRKLFFDGYKIVNTAAFLNPWEIWRQTATLYVKITEDGGRVVGRGTLRVQPSDFKQQMKTFQSSGRSTLARLGSSTKFFSYFAKQLAVPFLSTMGRLQWPEPTVNDSAFKVTVPTQVMPLVASDGVETRMLMWNPLKDGDEVTSTAPVILFVPGAAVDHGIFASPTIEKNTITYFREAGYRSYCLVHRVGRLPVARDGHTPYDARLDVHAALAQVRKLEGARIQGNAPKVYVVAHCAGSVALACGILDGTIPGEWIRGMTSSQVFMHPKFGKVNQVMSLFPTQLYSRLISPWWDCSSNRDDTYVQRVVNQVLRLYPIGSARETCRSVVCHRTSFVFGRLWPHENLNEETHRNLEQFFSGTSMRAIGYLMHAGRVGHVTTNSPANTNLVTPENIERLKGIPILFVAGSDNMAFTPENTDTTYTTLCHAHGKEWYQREVFQGRGHLDGWMGTTAYQDVYPRVLQHVEEVMGNTKYE